MTHCSGLPGNCGVGVLINLSGAKPKDFFLLASDCGYPVYVFSDIAGSDGRRLAKAIRKAGYGAVSQSRPKVNPNSQNKIEVFVWVTNYKFWKRKK